MKKRDHKPKKRKTILIHKIKQFMLTKTISKRSTYSRRWCKWVCKWWYWASNCQVFVKNMIKYIELMIFYQKQFWWWPQLYNEINNCGEKIKFKIAKVMKFTSKTRSSHFLLSVTFRDKFWRSHHGVLDWSN